MRMTLPEAILTHDIVDETLRVTNAKNGIDRETGRNTGPTWEQIEQARILNNLTLNQVYRGADEREIISYLTVIGKSEYFQPKEP